MQILIPDDELSVESTQSSPLQPDTTHFGPEDPDKLITPESINNEPKTAIIKTIATVIIIRLFAAMLFSVFLI